MRQQQGSTEYVTDWDDEYDFSSDSSDDEEVEPVAHYKRASGRRPNPNQQHVTCSVDSTHGAGRTDRFPPIMGGSMAAQVQQFAGFPAQAATITGAHVSMAPSFPPGLSRRPQGVPVVSTIQGAVNREPQPYDPRGGTTGAVGAGGGALGAVQSSYGPQNEIARPMENVLYRRTPVLPFNRQSDTSAYDVGRSPFQLFSAQGFDQDSYRPKREQGPMFTPQPENIYGQPNQAEVQRDRYQPSNELRHQKPFEAEWSLRSGGFHPTTRILPTNVPVLRQQLPQNYVAGPSKATSHPSGLFGESRGELGLTQRKGADLSFYYRVPFPSSVANQAAQQRADIVDRPTSRQCLSRPYGGGADSSGAQASGIQMRPGQHVIKAQRAPSQQHARLQVGAAGGPGAQQGGGPTAHYMDKAKPTRAEFSEMATPASVSGVRAPVAAGQAPPQDVARPTRAQFNELRVMPQTMNVPGGVAAPTMQFQDEARMTRAQFNELHVRPTTINAPGGVAAPTMPFQDEARVTRAQFGELQVLPQFIDSGAPGAPTMPFQDEARATRAQFNELHVRPSTVDGAASHPGAPMVYLQDGARLTLKQGTESAHLITGLQSAAGAGGGATYTAPMDEGRATRAEATEMAGETAVGGASAAGRPQGAMAYLMDQARATLKQFTSDHDYTGGAGQSELQAAMNRDSSDVARLNDKLEQTNMASRAPNQGPMGVVGTNDDRLGYGDASTVRVRNDDLCNTHQPPADHRGEGFGRWIPQVSVNSNRAAEERWVNDRNSPYVLDQLQSNPYSIPMFAQTGNMNLPVEVSAGNPQ